MPWRVHRIPIKGGRNWAIQKKVGKRWIITGRSKTKAKAQASVNARRAAEGSR